MLSLHAPARPEFGIGGMWLHPDEMIVDNFAGGGGASEGIEEAFREIALMWGSVAAIPQRIRQSLLQPRYVDIAINHDAAAVAMHAANHPRTLHLCQNIWQADPDDLRRKNGGRPLGLAWFSPDCTHHSKAKGAQPVESGRRDLAHVVEVWLKRWPPRIIFLENVEEFRDWGPLIKRADGKLIPDPKRKGETFAQWCAMLRRYGYRLQFKELRACDYGTPTIRKRLYLIARNDNLPIVWPKKTHGRPGSADVASGKLLPWPVAADIIDFSLPCPSIFDTAEEIWRKYGIRAKRPLVENTMARIGKGTWRYVIEAAANDKAFIIPVTHNSDQRVHSGREPLPTQTTSRRGEHALVTPFVTKFRQNSVGHPVTEPTHTITAHSSATHPGGAAPIGVVTPYLTRFNENGLGQDAREPTDTMMAGAPRFGVVAPYLVPRYGERPGQEPRTRSVDEPMPTPVPTGNEASVVAPVLMSYYGGEGGTERTTPATQPVGTDTTGPRHAVVSAFLAQHNTGVVGHDAREPVSTTLAGTGHQAVVQVSAGQINLKGSDRRGRAITEGVPALCANGNHAGEVRAFLVKYFSAATHGQSLRDPLHTDTAKPRFGLVVIHGDLYEIVDIGMRMLTVRERFRANGFPETYIIDVLVNGKAITAEQQGRCCGNAVCPPMARALVLANLGQPANTSRRVAQAVAA